MDWLHNNVGSDFWYHVIIAIVIVAIFGLSSRAVRAVLRWLSNRLFPRTKTTLDDRIVDVVLSHVRPLLLIIGFHIGVREIGKGTPAADVTLLQVLSYAEGILYIASVIVVIKVLLGIIRQIISWYLERLDISGSGLVNDAFEPLVGKLISLAVGLVGVIVVLDHFGVSVGSLLVSLGVGSLAVALAAQDTLANMIAGFVILIDRPFRVGDRVEIASGHVADVLSIGLRSTRLVNFDGNVIILPNAELIKGRITNYSSPLEQMRVVVKMNVGYGTDVEKVRRILLELARQHSGILSDPAPVVELTALNDSSLECTLFARAESFTKAGPITSELREKAYQRFLTEGIEIPFPQRVVHAPAKKNA